MKMLFIVFSIICTVSSICAQEEKDSKPHKDIRRTIGINSSLLPSGYRTPSFNFYMGELVYRKCFKSFVLSSQLSYLHHKNNPLLLASPNTVYYETDSIATQINRSSAMNGQRIGAALHKGWTNSKVNIYLGIGISVSHRTGSVFEQKLERNFHFDSISNQQLFQPEIETNKTHKGSYFTYDIGIVATLEIPIVSKITATLSIKPEVSSYYLYKTFGAPSYFNLKNNVMQHSNILLGVHYRLK